MLNEHRRFQPRRQGAADRSGEGFTLVETLVSLSILVFGVLAAAQIVYTSTLAGTLSRSKGGAAVAAQSQLEHLADLYSRDPSAPELSTGGHGPREVQITNPAGGTVLNRFAVRWTAAPVPDPRPGRRLGATRVTVTVTPVDDESAPRPRPALNKAVNVSTILSVRIR
jgi:type II secretory pathway pseudopilin PulG